MSISRGMWNVMLIGEHTAFRVIFECLCFAIGTRPRCYSIAFSRGVAGHYIPYDIFCGAEEGIGHQIAITIFRRDTCLCSKAKFVSLSAMSKFYHCNPLPIEHRATLNESLHSIVKRDEMGLALSPSFSQSVYPAGLLSSQQPVLMYKDGWKQAMLRVYLSQVLPKRVRGAVKRTKGISDGVSHTGALGGNVTRKSETQAGCAVT
ncbi:uncharacterized protein ARMOST_07956 [Armillaria ostoyae]|uniref:Uncharacterized protein n=1 Tax=Armillaria ostoyae TaxID=47428 RepID=A0A284R783_ARMOS|nr:uncharacterized protein ARMOST_07956 [Armillaria ostoyae]